MAGLRCADGDFVDGASWLARIDDVDGRALRHVTGPALDVGCGPGRHVVALAERGVLALGIDIAPSALDSTRRRGGVALLRSIFDHVPGCGRWRTVILLDGNVGIGGDAVALLRRVHEVVEPGGRALVEAEPPGTLPRVASARLELHGATGPWFDFATVPIDEVPRIAVASGFVVASQWVDGDRWFALLVSR